MSVLGFAKECMTEDPAALIDRFTSTMKEYLGDRMDRLMSAASKKVE
jgi:hypothetical protein